MAVFVQKRRETHLDIASKGLEVKSRLPSLVKMDTLNDMTMKGF